MIHSQNDARLHHGRKIVIHHAVVMCCKPDTVDMVSSTGIVSFDRGG